MVPPPLNAVLMAACVSWHAASCLVINLLLWGSHSTAMWVHESGNLHSGHASVAASLYRYVVVELTKDKFKYSCAVLWWLSDLGMECGANLFFTVPLLGILAWEFESCKGMCGVSLGELRSKFLGIFGCIFRWRRACSVFRLPGWSTTGGVGGRVWTYGEWDWWSCGFVGVRNPKWWSFHFFRW